MRWLLCSLVVVLSAGFACAQSATSSDEKQIMALEEAYEKAVDKQDSAALMLVERHMTDTVITIGSFGGVWYESRKETIDDIKKPDGTTKLKQSEYKINIDGDTAVVTYRGVASMSGRKNRALDVEDLPSNCMDVFIKRKGQWLGWATTCTPTKPVSQAAYDAIAEMQKK